jgi:amino acid transporter
MWLTNLIYMDALISPTGTAMVYTASSARMVMAMSDNKHLPSYFERTNRYNMPSRALIFNTTIGILLLLCLGNLQKLVSFQSSAMILAYSMGPCSFLALRERLPHLDRPFKIPLPWLMGWVVFFVCNTLIYGSSWTTCKFLFFTVIVGFIAYACLLPNKERWTTVQQNAWLFLHWVILCAISYAGNHEGGLGTIPHGYDYLLLAVESALMLYWSVIASQDAPTMRASLESIPQR